MSPAQLARYAMRAWALAADQVHELHTGYEEWLREHPPLSIVDLRKRGDDEEGYLSRRTRYQTDMKLCQSQMVFWLQVAQTAADVANLPDGGEAELEPVTLAGYDLAAARGWFDRVRERGESGEPLKPGERAAARWRIMSPDQRAATIAIVGDVLVVAAEL
jgi:hypothetical protein